ncbi:MAG: family 20 glycosylhydrolase, partial [Gemmatimonadaceae bacterium]
MLQIATMISRTIALLLLAPSLAAAQVNSLLPVPRAITAGTGRFTIDSTTRVVITRHRDPRLERAVARAIAKLSERIGQPLTRQIGTATLPNGAAESSSIDVRVEGPGGAVQAVKEDESYQLNVNASSVVLSAPTTTGAIHGLETLLQLVVGNRTSFALPAVAIDDSPRFPWRGLNVDVSRHFMPVDQVKRTIDGMSMVKLNVLHWHLSDDQGFRVESKRFPKLHELGSDGDFYTQAQVRDVVAYARDRGIRVIPEFDMPGHSTSWFVGYPQFSAQPAPIRIRREWGGADAIFDPTREGTYTFIARFIGEMAPLFPDAYWHVGGDEVEGKHWNRPAIIAWRKRHGMKDNDALQAYFNRRVSRILSSLGKKMIGWDEILHPDLPPGTVVQSWRGTKYLSDGAKRGFTGILSAPWYLDHIEPATDFYLADPVPQFDELTEAQRALIIGGEACMWAEYITSESADSRIWPRL